MIRPAILALLSFLAAIALLSACSANATGSWSDFTDEEFQSAFDDVARNLGATEYACYTFMTEFNRSPESLDELRESGHLNIAMSNPYTGDDVISLVPDDSPDGDLAGNILVSSRDNGQETHLEIWYVIRYDDGEIHLRSMVQRLTVISSSLDREYFFSNDLPRDEQFVAVYCRQAVDAVECFGQRNGRVPDDFDDMYANGDVNVHYINPLTGEVVVPSECLSPGNYYYETIGDDEYLLIGWGREFPVFFSTTNSDAEADFYAQWPELSEDEPGSDE